MQDQSQLHLYQSVSRMRRMATTLMVAMALVLGSVHLTIKCLGINPMALLLGARYVKYTTATLVATVEESWIVAC